MTAIPAEIATLSALLDQQKTALLQGDLTLLAQLPDKFEKAMDRLSKTRPSAVDLTRLAKTAEHNARLVSAARDGLARVGRDRTKPATLTTYDAVGRQQPPTAEGQLISRR